jgi:hypothetical protein
MNFDSLMPGGLDGAMYSAPGAAMGGSALLGGAAAGGGMAGLASLAGGPVGMVAGMVLSGIQAASARRQAISDQKVNQQNNLAQTGYAMALQDWYKRKDKGERRMGLENYNQFNTMEQIAPGYKDVYKPAALGKMPNSDDYVSHRNQKKQNVKIKNQEKAGQATIGSVTMPGG